MSVAAQFPNSAWNGLTPNHDDHLDRKSPNADDWDRIAAEVVAVEQFLIDGQSDAVGTAGTDVVAATTAGQVNKTVLTITDLEVAMTDATDNVGFAEIFGFPEGNILVLGAVSDLTLVGLDTGIDADAAVVASLGSADVGTDNATLTSTEADIIPSTAATFTNAAGVFAGQSTAVAVLNGTVTPAAVRLNIAVPDADSTGNDTITVNGTVTLTWINLGDQA